MWRGSPAAYANPFWVWGSSMKAYLITTGILFAVITVAHVWEVVDEWIGDSSSPAMRSFWP